MSQPTHFPDLPKAPHALEAELVITTPMFLGSGGKDQHATSIRPPSIKGALRFWWRALQWPRLYLRFGNVATALSALHAQEAELFGLAAGHKDAQGNDIGEQGRFRIHIVQPNVNVSDRYQPPVSVQYLLGNGLYRFRKGLLRKPLQHGNSFTLVLAAKPGARPMTPAQWQSLEESLLCWGLLGGLGARARKGLGSVSVQSLKGGRYQAPRHRDAYESLLQQLLAPLQGQEGKLPPFTAFSSTSRVDISLEAERAEHVLERLGHEMQMYRSYGRNGWVNGQEAERKFDDDHDLVLRAIHTGTLTHVPRRSVFGLPHNYYFSSLKQGFEISAALGGQRASPLLLHVHRLSNGQYLGVATLLPAVFLPASDANLTAGVPKGNKRQLPLQSGDIDWRVLHTYLDRFEQSKTLVHPIASNPQEAQT